MDNIAIGIDPGVKGAIAIIENNKVRRIWDMPTTIMSWRKKKPKYIDADGIFAIIDPYVGLNNNNIIIGIEDVHSHPNDGHKGAFSFGLNTGIVLGVLDSNILSSRIKHIPAQIWKKYFGLIGAPKKESLKVAKKYYKSLKSIDCAEAFLIAKFIYDSFLIGGNNNG